MTACSVPSLLGRYLAQLGALGTDGLRGGGMSVYLWLHRARSLGRLSWSLVLGSVGSRGYRELVRA